MKLLSFWHNINIKIIIIKYQYKIGKNKKNGSKKSEDQLSKTILTIDCKNFIKMMQNMMKNIEKTLLRYDEDKKFYVTGEN